MKKEFVPYEPALELKQLQFDEECIYHYKKNNEGKHSSNPTFEMLTPFGQNHNILESRVSAPSYSQAFRWFRENHNCDVKIEMESKEFYIGFYWSGVAWVSIGSGTYEEAELICLKKLIQIQKKTINNKHK